VDKPEEGIVEKISWKLAGRNPVRRILYSLPLPLNYALRLLIVWDFEGHLTSFELGWALVAKSCELWSMAMMTVSRKGEDLGYEGYIYINFCSLERVLTMTKASRVDPPRRWPMCFLERKCLNDAALRFCIGVLKFDDFTCILTEAYRIRKIRLSMLLSIFLLSVSP
jgi:hypothetical protein